MIPNDLIENRLEEPIPSQVLNAILGGQNEERIRIARDLHDSLGCLLSTTSLLFDTIEPVNKERYEEVRVLLDETRGELRRIVNNLMPRTLEKLGLIPAIEQLCAQISKGGQLKLSFLQENMETASLEKDLEINIYRIIQELLNNTIKHSNASKVELLLKYYKNSICFYLKGNGNRLIESDFKKLSIRARIWSLGGKIILEDCSDSTSIRVELPVAKV